jgi:hypothetical protein
LKLLSVNIIALGPRKTFKQGGDGFLFKNMDTNLEIYIQYEDTEPVPVGVYYSGGRKRELPLKTVSQLIAAYKVQISPLLDDVSVAQMTLHRSADSARLRPGQSLDEFEGVTDIHPIVLRVKPVLVRFQQPSQGTTM